MRTFRHVLPPIIPIIRYIHLNASGDDNKKEYFARKLIGFSENQLYSVISDVSNYEQFLPFCRRSVILSRKPEQLQATLVIGYPPVEEKYTSTVTLRKPRLVQAVCTEGSVFTSLKTVWKFSPGTGPKTCITDFYVSFEVSSRLYSRLASMFFDQLAQQMEDAFIEEATRRYGQASVPCYTIPMKPKK